MYFQLAEDQERLQELLALQEDIEDEEEELYKVIINTLLVCILVCL